MTAWIRYRRGTELAARYPTATEVPEGIDYAHEMAERSPNEWEISATPFDDEDEFGTPQLPFGDHT